MRSAEQVVKGIWNRTTTCFRFHAKKNKIKSNRICKVIGVNILTGRGVHQVYIIYNLGSWKWDAVCRNVHSGLTQNLNSEKFYEPAVTTLCTKINHSSWIMANFPFPRHVRISKLVTYNNIQQYKSRSIIEYIEIIEYTRK